MQVTSVHIIYMIHLYVPFGELPSSEIEQLLIPWMKESFQFHVYCLGYVWVSSTLACIHAHFHSSS